MSVIDMLITDRVSGATYNASDLNRVGEAVSYVAARLQEVGIVVSVTAKTDWLQTDFPTRSAIDTYRENIRAIRAAVSVGESTPTAPPARNCLTVEDANAIEAILRDVDTLLDGMQSIIIPSGASMAVAGLTYYFRGT